MSDGGEASVSGGGPERILRTASAFYESALLFAAIDIGVFEVLAREGETGVGEVAEELGCSARGLRLLLDACVATGLLEKRGEAYRNSREAAMYLVPGVPSDLSRAIRYNRDVYAAWGKLTEMVRTGRPVEAPSLHLGDDSARTRTFVMSMHSRALGMGRAVVPHVELAGCEKLLDIGGGPGTYSVLLAQANPGLTCTVMDLPDVVAIARELIERQRMGDRVRTLAGSYRESAFPEGQDAVIFFGVLHQESAESVQALLRKAYGALNPGGVLYVMDMMTGPDRAHPPFSALFAVNMALTTDHGWVFSDAELIAWLTAAGFERAGVKPLPAPMPHWLASAHKPQAAGNGEA